MNIEDDETQSPNTLPMREPAMEVFSSLTARIDMQSAETTREDKNKIINDFRSDEPSTIRPLLGFAYDARYLDGVCTLQDVIIDGAGTYRIGVVTVTTFVLVQILNGDVTEEFSITLKEGDLLLISVPNRTLHGYARRLNLIKNALLAKLAAKNSDDADLEVAEH